MEFYNYPFNQTFIKTFEAYSDAVQYRGGGASRAAKYGAQAVIVRSMSESTDNIPHTGALRYDSAQKMIPAVAIGLQDADWLSNELRTGTVSVTVSTHGKFLPDTVGHNVIGELKGTEFPNEYITVGGHLDSWDPAEGAHDDGGDRGVIFMCLQASIARQFEFVQSQWMNRGNVFVLGEDQDVLVGPQDGSGPHKMTVPGNPPFFLGPLERVVTVRGGEYFFVPGINGLEFVSSAAASGAA